LKIFIHQDGSNKLNNVQLIKHTTTKIKQQCKVKQQVKHVGCRLINAQFTHKFTTYFVQHTESQARYFPAFFTLAPQSQT